MKRKFLVSLVILPLICISVISFKLFSKEKSVSSYSTNITSKSTNTLNNRFVCKAVSTSSNSASSEVSFLSAGDILFHMPEVVAAQENGTYNFRPMFSEVKDIVSSKDISVADFETTVDPKKGPSGYPAFNTPVQALDAVKDTGFQVLLNDHNHSLDTGLEGLESTDDLIKKYGFKLLGSGEPKDDKSVIIEKNNIKIGLLSYAYGTNMGVQYKDRINYIDEAKIKSDMENILPKCDFVVVYLHIGTEYVRTVEPFQAELVKKVAAMGANAILCSHPHVARKTEMLKVNGREVLVNYSMGNFISNQNDKYTDIGSMENIVIEKSGGLTQIKSAETIPVYRLRYNAGGKTIYKTVPYSKISNFSSILGQSTISYITDTSESLKFTYNSKSLKTPQRKLIIYNEF